MNIQSKVFAAGMIVALSACGGGSSGEPQVFDVPRGSPAPTYDPASGVLFRNGVPIASRSDTVIDNSGRASVTTNGTDIYQARAEVDNEVFAVLYNDFEAGQGYLLGRREVPDLPAGSASFVGGYSGLSIRTTPGTSGLSGAVTGRVRMDVDFDQMELAGRITDRKVVTESGNEFSLPITAADVTLRGTRLRDNGLFAGEASGGEFIIAASPNLTFDASRGIYEGLIGGGSGEYVAGAFSLDHRRSDGRTFEERGVFVAE